MNKLHIINFILLLFIAVAQQPVQDGVKAIATNYSKKAHREVCGKIYDRKDLYSDNIHSVFISGCLYDRRSVLLALSKPKDQERIKKIFEDQTSPEFDEISVACQDGAYRYEQQSGIMDRIMEDLYVTFQCAEALRE